MGWITKRCSRGKIPFKWKSEDGSKTINELSTPNCDKKYWKEVNKKIEEMTSQEKADKDQEIAASSALEEANKKDFTYSASKLYKAMGLAFLDAINTVRAEVSLPALTVDQLRTAIANKYDTLG